MSICAFDANQRMLKRRLAIVLRMCHNQSIIFSQKTNINYLSYLATIAGFISSYLKFIGNMSKTFRNINLETAIFQNNGTTHLS